MICDLAVLAVGTVSRISAHPTALFNGQTPLGMSNTNAMELETGAAASFSTDFLGPGTRPQT
jgi:hypothetical protein